MNRKLGVLMLDTRFERIPGDIGNPASFDFPVLYRTVHGATAARVIRGQDTGLVELFAREAEELVRDGASAITTSCGFLARHQDELAERISVPFAASALICLTELEGMHRRIGVITADENALGPDHLPPFCRPPAAVVGLQDSPAFRNAIIDGSSELDPGAIEMEVAEAARRMLSMSPDVDAVVLECTNLPPYRKAIEAVLPVPIYDSLWLARGLMKH